MQSASLWFIRQSRGTWHLMWPYLDFKMNEVKQQKLSRNAMLSIVVKNPTARSVTVGNFRQPPSDLWLFSSFCRVWMSFHDRIWRNWMISDCTPSSARTPLAVCDCVIVFCVEIVIRSQWHQPIKKLLCENESKRTEWKKICAVNNSKRDDNAITESRECIMKVCECMRSLCQHTKLLHKKKKISLTRFVWTHTNALSPANERTNEQTHVDRCVSHRKNSL